MDSQLRKRRMVGGVEKVVNICSFETLKNLETNKGDKEREDHPSPYTKSAYFKKGKIT